ncbi:MAG: hypothetical protein RL701_4887 [Pseudomonadota bacterium]
MTRVKICGVTSVDDALMCVDAGADAIGLNFAPSSPRCLSLDVAESIIKVLPPHVLSVGVFVDADYDTLTRVKTQLGLRCLQLHGAEPPELLARFLPHAYKALRVRGPNIVSEAAVYPGEHLLVDAYVPGVHGGSGARFDWSLVTALARTRKLTLAGGLTPDNVATAIDVVRPFCVDVASGVESKASSGSRPGKKDEGLVARFIHQAKRSG